MSPILFCDEGCPYAHRPLALLAHLGVEHEVRSVPLGQRPAGLERYSDSGRIPLLVHDELVLGESAVMLDYLAERFGFDAAWPSALTQRARARHAMALADEALTPLLFRPEAVRAARRDECLAVLEETARTQPPAPSLLAFHLAPIWARLRAWRPGGAATRAIEARPALRAWLDAARALPAVARTETGTDPAFVAAASILLA